MTAYSILTVDDSRKALKDQIRVEMADAGIEEFPAKFFVDGRIPGAIDVQLADHRLEVTGQPFHNGELGIWFSALNTMKNFIFWGCEKDNELIIFEDDAIVSMAFKSIFPLVMAEMPDDMDFFAWAIPADQKVDYYYNRHFTPDGGWIIASHIRHSYEQSPHHIPGKELVCKTYQGYQAVCIMYSRNGILKIIELLQRDGIHSPIDLFLFTEAFKGNLNGYTLLPDVYPMVTFEEKGTIARNSGMYN